MRSGLKNSLVLGGRCSGKCKDPTCPPCYDKGTCKKRKNFLAIKKTQQQKKIISPGSLVIWSGAQAEARWALAKVSWTALQVVPKSGHAKNRIKCGRT